MHCALGFTNEVDAACACRNVVLTSSTGEVVGLKECL